MNNKIKEVEGLPGEDGEIESVEDIIGQLSPHSENHSYRIDHDPSYVRSIVKGQLPIRFKTPDGWYIDNIVSNVKLCNKLINDIDKNIEHCVRASDYEGIGEDFEIRKSERLSEYYKENKGVRYILNGLKISWLIANNHMGNAGFFEDIKINKNGYKYFSPLTVSETVYEKVKRFITKCFKKKC